MLTDVYIVLWSYTPARPVTGTCAAQRNLQVRGISASLLVTVDSASNGGSAHTLQALAREVASWAACTQTAVSDGQAFGLLHGALSSGSGLKTAITLLANHDCGAAVGATGVVFM